MLLKRSPGVAGALLRHFRLVSPVRIPLRPVHRVLGRTRCTGLTSRTNRRWQAQLSEAAGWITDDGGDAGSVTVDEDEGIAINLVVALPADCKVGAGLLEIDIFGISVPRQADGEVVGGIEQPCIAGFGREQHQRTNGDETAVVFGGAVPNKIDLISEKEILSVQPSFPRSAFDCFTAH